MYNRNSTHAMLRTHTHTHTYDELWIVPSPYGCIGCLSYPFFRSEFLLSLRWKPLLSHIALYYCLMSSKWNSALLLTDVPWVNHTVFHLPVSSFLYQYKLAYSLLCGSRSSDVLDCIQMLDESATSYWRVFIENRFAVFERKRSKRCTTHDVSTRPSLLFTRLFCFSVVSFTTPFIPDPMYLSEVAEKITIILSGWPVSRRFEPATSRLQMGLFNLYTAL